MRIGQLARKAEVNVQTIRFYERQHILPPAPRDGSRYRSYSDADLATVRFIRHSQGLGFTLKEIKQLMPLHESIMTEPKADARRPKDVRVMSQIAHDRLRQVEEKLRALKMMRMQLLTMIDRLETGTPRCAAAGGPCDDLPARRPHPAQ